MQCGQSPLAALLIIFPRTSDFFVPCYRFLLTSGSLPKTLILSFLLAHGRGILIVTIFAIATDAI